MSQLNLSTRGYLSPPPFDTFGRTSLKLARTIADLAGSEEIRSVPLAEALHASQSSEVDDGVNL